MKAMNPRQTQINAKPAKRVALTTSSKIAQPITKLIVGTRYCIGPRIVSGVRCEAPANNSSGTDHAWANRSDKVCRVAFILVDGKFTDELVEKVPSIKDSLMLNGPHD